MGLIELVKSGSILERGAVTLTNSPTSLGETTQFQATYILLGATRVGSTDLCRVRLYGDSGSVAIDAPRPSGSFDYSASVALNLEVSFSPGSQSVIFDPPIIATAYLDNKTYYNIESVSTDTVSIDYYPIGFDTSQRGGLTTPQSSIPATDKISGSITTMIRGSETFMCPRSFVILQAASSHANTRLRLYSRPIEQVNLTEQNRAYTSSFSDGSYLIVDMLFDSASFNYRMTPNLQGFNLETYPVGENRVGYIFENLSGSPITNAFASVTVYPVED